MLWLESLCLVLVRFFEDYAVSWKVSHISPSLGEVLVNVTNRDDALT